MELQEQTLPAENLIEKQLIAKLQEKKYIYRDDIRNRASLEANFRKKFEELNGVTLTDSEFKRLLDKIISDDVFASAERLRSWDDFEREDSTPLIYTLVNVKDWCKNSFEVVNQLRMNTYSGHHRYDVMLLINGLPLVHIELKTISVSPRKALEQIVDYKNDPNNGFTNSLLCFVQLFIVSNRTDTFYFANNDKKHFSFNADERFLPVYQYADKANTKIKTLDAFADNFLAKCTLIEMISRYMVLVLSERRLLMMRPYQIYAVQAIVECIKQNCGNGYVWHTTGSGKTLTSFKASTLLKDFKTVDKVLFVVDRKDLDRQTREEFNRFQEGCVEENTNTGTLVRRMLSDDHANKVIVTTIQKLGLALDQSNRDNHRERLAPLRDKRMVFIFDECHRSQFGDNHEAIRSFFHNAQLFGFTGTPIFEKNSTQSEIQGTEKQKRTTESLFPSLLHSYTITNAIEDKNVLKFRVDYFKPKEDVSVGLAQELPKEKVVETILEKHDSATAKRKFNALFATARIDDAIAYYQLFKEMQRTRALADPDFRPLNIACVFSPPAEGNPDVKQLQQDLVQESEDNKQDPETKKAALKTIIADYNNQYGTNHSVGEFDLYYQDVQKRIKDQQYPNRDLGHEQKIDVTIVVDMLLTGFDSKYLNTLYVDKNLKYHGLIQAFSRTNRVLNDTKPFGIIIDFRQQQEAVNEAIKLFSGSADDGANKRIWLVESAEEVIVELAKRKRQLDAFFESQGLESKPEEVGNLKGDHARALFVEKFKEIQRLQTQLDQYTDLTPEQEQQVLRLVPPDVHTAFRQQYLDVAKQMRPVVERPSPATPPEVLLLDFELVLFASVVIDYDYIMKLLADGSTQPPENVRASRDKLVRLIQADAKFQDDGDMLVEYINSLPLNKPITEVDVKRGLDDHKALKQREAVDKLAAAHRLDADALQGFVHQTVSNLRLDSEQLAELMAPLQLGWRERGPRERELMLALAPLLLLHTNGTPIYGLSAYTA